ncbi:uncharacterized protein CANTADRAFT_89650 [Suhomyces tanzawaensis NRRL Y-17324]|uniref:Uncharacterized protein n=1 Tax=Suhomyces tanzawaensis NRRL Y-17324 TaxID=984487 RepID=A0A1E4SKV0_9ASCO|nr:uncharacterized protein CANTADRAFT_89650 [Suhomyces tanzawaensis NRRL Y-17324]ODV80067.1 hypothetical protein CANTADRAFT_89650 [Suhomyces tanzawaensis NRRL Y-17324]
MIGPHIPKELREQRKKQKEAEKTQPEPSEDISSDDDIDGPQLGPPVPQVPSLQEEKHQDGKKSDSEVAKKPTLLELHQKKLKESGISDKNRIHKFDHKQGLNDEVKKEILRNVNAKGLSRFTTGSK